MLQLPLLFLGVFFLSLIRAQSFNAVAFGNRVFTEDTRTFISFDGVPGLVFIGEARLSAAPTLGTIKQENCEDEVDVTGVINFENGEFIFCYEGGPQMVNGATDTATFSIFANNGVTSTYVAEFRGSDPIVPLDFRDRLVLTDENVPVDIDSNLFAVFVEDVTELEVFQIQIDQIPSEELGTLTDSSGNVLANGAVVNSNEVITFNPAQDFSNCAPVDELGNTVCSVFADDPPVNFGDQFTFSLTIGEGEDQFIRGSFTFFMLVELRTVGELSTTVNEIVIPANTVVNNRVLFTLDTSFVSVDVVAEDADRDISLTISILDRDEALIRNQFVSAPPGINRLQIGFCDNSGSTICRITLVGTAAAITSALEDDIIIFEFDADTFESTRVLVLINGDDETSQTITFFPLDEFKAVAFGNRVFSVSAAAFLSFDEDDVATLIAAGDATLSVGPTQGTLKQPDCNEIVDVNDFITFENGVLTFCFEGGPGMLNGVEDILRFNIVGDDGATSTFQADFIGSDPVVPVDFLERRIQTPENVSIDFPATAFAVFEEDVTEIDEFRILFDRSLDDFFGTLTDSNGIAVGDGDIISSDEVLTFVPRPGFDMCAPLPVFPRAECPGPDEDPTFFPAIPSFIFRIVFGEGEEETTGEPLEFFYIIESAVADAQLVIQNEVITVPVEDAVNGLVNFALDTSFLSVIPEPEDVNILLSISFRVLTESAFSLIDGEFSGTGLKVSQRTPCIPLNDFACQLILTGTGEAVNRALDLTFVSLIFDANEVADATLEVTLNGEDIVREITFEPLGTPPPVAEPPGEEDDGGISNAAVGILATLGTLVGLGMVGALIFFIISQSQSNSEAGEDNDEVKVPPEEEEKESPEEEEEQE